MTSESERKQKKPPGRRQIKSLRTTTPPRLSEERFRDLIDDLPLGISITSPDGRQFLVNKAFLRMRGYASVDELKKEPILQRYYDPKDRDRWLALIKEKGSVEGFEVRLRRKNGSIFWALAYSIPQTTASGEQLLVSVTYDITERKLAEEKFKTIFDAVADGIVVMEPESKRYYEANHAFCRMLGYTRDEIKTIGMINIHPVNDLLQIIAKFERLGDTAEGQFRDIPVKRKNGSVFYADINSAPGTFDGKNYQIGIFRDVTERKLVEARLELAAKEWRTTFDSMSDMISVHDKDFNIVRVNKAFADALKMSPHELIGKQCYRLVHGTSGPVPYCPFLETLKTRKVARKDFFEPHLGMHIEVLTSPIFDDRGEVTAFVHIIRDITERKNMEEQLIISDRLASIGQLASGIAHELNNPLTSIIGFSELLLKREIADDIKQDLIIINKEAARTSAIVKGLLTFAHKQDVIKEPVNINEIIQDVFSLRSYEHRLNNIEVVTHFAAELPKIFGSSSQLEQVFMNIIVNAEQAMLERKSQGMLTVATELSGGVVRISISDNGPGITKENMMHIFTPFFTTKEAGKGTGLGLSICHGIVTEHGGKIRVESLVGKGATFIVELPVADLMSSKEDTCNDDGE